MENGLKVNFLHDIWCGDRALVYVSYTQAFVLDRLVCVPYTRAYVLGKNINQLYKKVKEKVGYMCLWYLEKCKTQKRRRKALILRMLQLLKFFGPLNPVINLMVHTFSLNCLTKQTNQVDKIFPLLDCGKEFSKGLLCPSLKYKNFRESHLECPRFYTRFSHKC